MKIANIIYKDELVNHKRVDYINYMEKPISIDQIKKGVPTLYVGWCYFKELNKYNKIASNVDILEKEIIPKKLYWEFSYDEKKSDHINGVLDFVISAPTLYFSNKYFYKFINPIYDNIKNINDLTKYDFHINMDVFYNYKNKMIYILDKYINENNLSKMEYVIYGVDLDLFNFLGFNRDDTINFFQEKSIKIINDIDGSLSSEYLSSFNCDSNMVKYLPVICNK